jgi:dephospho-CoA kinase
MDNNSFKEGFPIILGLSGKAGSGKTSVAENIVPKGSIETVKNGCKWDHIFFALPLYELATVKRSIKGFNEKNRQLFSMHQVMFDIYGGSAIGDLPDYDDLVSRVHDIYELPIEQEGVKPRTFLQTAGDICRKDFENCFSKWGVRKAKVLYSSYKKTIEEDQEEMPFVVIISDVRFENEAQEILNQPNGRVICFDASEETLNERLTKRDGTTMSKEQSNHRSEKQIDTIKSIASSIINTDGMSIEEQTEATLASLGLLRGANA